MKETSVQSSCGVVVWVVGIRSWRWPKKNQACGWNHTPWKQRFELLGWKMIFYSKWQLWGSPPEKIHSSSNRRIIHSQTSSQITKIIWTSPNYPTACWYHHNDSKSTSTFWWFFLASWIQEQWRSGKPAGKTPGVPDGAEVPWRGNHRLVNGGFSNLFIHFPSTLVIFLTVCHGKIHHF